MLALRRNLGRVDRTIRVVIGFGLIALVFVGPKVWWGWLGLLLVASGFFGY
ncbi:MAG: DUF2892 domain-containing protein [Thermodesulfobacteriota bacterium]